MLKRVLFSLLLIPVFPSAVFGESTQLAWALHYEPRTFDPAQVADEAAENIRALTGGVLVRVDRRTLAPTPQLASDWSVSANGRTITLHLRKGLQFSDGSPLKSQDVVWTIQHLLDPRVASPKATLFPAGTTVRAIDPLTVIVNAPVRIDSPDWAFDEISIQPAGRGNDERVTAGPFYVSQHVQGQYVELARNPHYWRAGFPRVAAIHLDILGNREQEMLRLVRGQYQFADSIPPADVAAINARAAGLVHDLGPSLETEQLWFNQSPKSPIPAYKRAWFTSREFRVAVSRAINRGDLARIAWDGHATPADGFYSPAGGAWRSRSLHIPGYDPAAAQAQLGGLGWKLKDGRLFDNAGHAVEFSIVTNSGNEPRAKMLALLQQDLARIGIHVNIVKLDMPALIERLTTTLDYEVCVLGTANATPTPESTRNIWLSSSADHQWNPSEPRPATTWEAEIDRDLRLVDTGSSIADRKRAFDDMQQTLADEQPILYLVYRNRISGASPRVSGLRASVLASPWWNIEELGLSQ